MGALVDRPMGARHPNLVNRARERSQAPMIQRRQVTVPFFGSRLAARHTDVIEKMIRQFTQITALPRK